MTGQAFTYHFERADGVQVSVDYKVTSWGYGGSYMEPPEPMEIELDKAYDTETGEPITLTEEESQAAEAAIYENPPEPDMGPDDDERD